MAGSIRGSTGAFYTPRKLVDALVVDALSGYLARSAHSNRSLIADILAGGSPDLDSATREHLRRRVLAIRILDPAAGSGAFLLSALQGLERLRDVLEGPPRDGSARFERRRSIIQYNLHGVDSNASAARLCELRLWLALVVDLEVSCIADVPSLPNLDINIRQGDALVDPIDFLMQYANLDHGRLALHWRKEMNRLGARRERYFHSAGTPKRLAQRRLRLAERDLALSFLADLSRQIDDRRLELRSAANSRDLFGKRSGLTQPQRRVAANLRRRKAELARLSKRIRDTEALPFFSFLIHFPLISQQDGGFHVVVGNPPWVRPHRWSELARSRLRERYSFLRNAGWQVGSCMAGAGRGFGAQLDLSALFLERSLELLAENGVLGFLLPAKLVRSLSAGALRQRLLSTTSLLRIEDCSLATARLFEATTYPLSLLLARAKAHPGHTTFIRVHDRHGGKIDFQLPQDRIPLLPDDTESPWVLTPAPVRAVLERMREAGPPLGAQSACRPCRGIFTGNNAIFIGSVGDLASRDRVVLQTTVSKVEIEAERLRPVLRGEDLGPWRLSVRRAIVWTHDDTGRVLPILPPATHAYLREHERTLRGRVDLKRGQPYWSLFRVRPEKWRRRVVWRDIAPAPCAAIAPDTVPFLGSTAPLISLNTVYQIAAASEEDAHLLAAVLNSTVARTYLKAFAERASGGYFRFLGWTVALLPFPGRSDAVAATRCIELSREAHARGTLSDPGSLDEAAADLYGLSPSQLDELIAFDAHLSSAGGVS